LTQVNLSCQDPNQVNKISYTREKQHLSKTSVYKGKQNVIDNFKADNIFTLMKNMDSPYHKGFIHPEELLSAAKKSISTTQMNYRDAEKITKLWKKGRKIQLDEFVHACKHPKDYIDFLKKENKYKKEIMKWKNQKFALADQNNNKTNDQVLVPSQGCLHITNKPKKSTKTKQRRCKNIQDSFKDYTNKIAKSLNNRSRECFVKSKVADHKPFSKPAEIKKKCLQNRRVLTKNNIICKEKIIAKERRDEYTANRFKKVTETNQQTNKKPLKMSRNFLRKSFDASKSHCNNISNLSRSQSLNFSVS